MKTTQKKPQQKPVGFPDAILCRQKTQTHSLSVSFLNSSQRNELPLLMALFKNSSYLTQESTFQQVSKTGHRQRHNFSITNTFVHAGDVQGQGSADSAQVHQLSLNNITYSYGHRYDSTALTQNVSCTK